MAYSTSRIWYGPEGYQHGTLYTPSSGSNWPLIIYRPGGGWAGGDVLDLESRLWWQHGLNEATSAYNEDYAVLVINTASIGYNRATLQLYSNWYDATFYSTGARKVHGGDYWRCILGHTSVAGGAGNEPGVGSGASAVWVNEGSNTTVWESGVAYSLGDFRFESGYLYQCIDAHTATSSDRPPWRVLSTDPFTVPANWADYWRPVVSNETGTRQVANLGETTPGGLDEMVRNCQEAVVWARRNATTLGINASKVVLAGASAGGQMVGCAAYAEPLAWARLNEPASANRSVPYVSSTPDALILSITPVDLSSNYHTLYGLLNALYGEDATTGQWLAREAAVKQAMSPLWVLKRTGRIVPTYLDYAAAGPHDPALSNLTGTPYHHADNGWLMLQYLAGARPTGLGRTDCRFLENATAGTASTEASNYRVYTSTTASPTTITAGAGAAAFKLCADNLFAWLATVLA